MPTFETPQPLPVSIETSQGTVHLIASERTDAVVSVQPSDPDRPADVEAAARTAIELVNGALAVATPRPSGLLGPLVGWKRAGSVEVTVELPEGCSLRAETGFVDLRGDGRLADVDIKTGAGDVRLDQTGSARVRTGAGRVTVEEVAGRAEIVASGEMTVGLVTDDVQIRNLNGRTWIGQVGGGVRVKSANGDITIDEAAGDVTAKTANGNIRIGQVAQGSVTMETSSGGLEIGVREGTAAWIDATTKFGRVRHDLTTAASPQPADETVQIRARTHFGDITITRSTVPDRQSRS